MKKTAVIVFAFLFALTAAISVSAADMTHNVGQLYVPYASEKPEIDGRLDAAEWKNALKCTVNDSNPRRCGSTALLRSRPMFTLTVM